MPVGRGSIERATNAGNGMNTRVVTMEQRLTDILAAIPTWQIVPVPKDWSGNHELKRPGDELISSIKAYGIIEPIILRRISDSQFQLLSGYQRVQAAKELDMKLISARVMEELTEEEGKKIYQLLHSQENRPQDKLHEAKFEAVNRITKDMPVYLL